MAGGRPSIRAKALQEHSYPVQCDEHRQFAREVEDQDSGNLTLNHSTVELVPPTIDSAQTATMILLCEHPARAGCESAQSIQRSSLRQPGPPAGCSRCERSLDTRSGCAASRRTANLRAAATCATPFGFCDSGADTVCGVRDHSAPRFAPPPPATSAAKPHAANLL